MRFRLPLAVVLAVVASITAAFADTPSFKTVNPGTFDPAKTFLVEAAWLDGIGCPTNSRTSPDGTTITHYTDPACTTGDSRDQRNQGLLLAKTGSTPNFAAAGADLKDVPQTVTELGFDIRKPIGPADPSGSHCGAGAPRFEIITNNTPERVYAIGCNSGSTPPTILAVGNGWLRLQWGTATPVVPQGAFPAATLGSLNVKSVSIVFDEGQDTGPDFFGLAVLDNIDVNGVLVGQGRTTGNGHVTDKDKEKKHKKDRD